MKCKQQNGQAMVFGLLFMGLIGLGMILLFNQGILTRDRVQVENAADAAAYSQAKLFARHQNLIAYTNRAIVANELSVGQVVALASWGKRYANMPRWINSFPIYQLPIAVIIPRPTIGDVVSIATLPWQILGIGARFVSLPVVNVYPQVVSSFNTIMGFFQKAFAIATFEAQTKIAADVVGRHVMDKPGGDTLEVAPLSTALLIQNFILTYFADMLPVQDLLTQLVASEPAPGGTLPTPPNDAEGLEEPDDQGFLADFLGSKTGDLVPSSMLVNVAPEMHSKSGTPNDIDSRNAAREYAALVNTQRNTWLNQRDFNFGPSLDLSLNFSLGFLEVKLSLSAFVGVGNEGGTAYVYNPLSTSAVGSKTPVYGWASVDHSSIGFQIDVGLQIRICLPVLGCVDVPPLEFGFGMGIPLGGATHQLVTNVGDEKLFGPQWGTPVEAGLISKTPYGDAMDPIHAATWAWGNVLSIYGLNRAEDVTTGYSGSPSFFALGEAHAESGRSKEFTVAVSKPLSAVKTSDNPNGLNIRQGRFALDTDTRNNPMDFAWGGDSERMMTISSAETYFAPPPGRDESPNQYSPWWDARLREPSKVVQMIASGEIDLADVLGLSDFGPATVVGLLMDVATDYLILPGIDRALEKLPPVIAPVAKPVINEISGNVLDKVKAGMLDTLQ
ncbi:hypothetical protein [Ectopseudomonas mendocina]|uniref:hypothetical protein n=1 Tax=Ectopseudomonas mendocina TaxID=300 RepID=UPI003132C26D